MQFLLGFSLFHFFLNHQKIEKVFRFNQYLCKSPTNEVVFVVDESRYYKNVAIWLEKKGYYIGRIKPKVYKTREMFIKRGMKKAQVDVAGVKNAGKSYFDDIEIAIVEVKHSDRQRPITLQELEQTRGYQDYAHICYLAATENVEITIEREKDAKNRNVGLLKIPLHFYKKKPNQVKIEDLEVIHTPNRTVPSDEAEMLEFLAKLDILRCTLCGCYFLSWEGNTGYEEEFSLSPKGTSFKRLERNRVFELFPDKVDFGLDTRHKYWQSKTWKHLCLLCVEDLEKLYGIDKLRKDMGKIKKEIAKLKHS